jgi:hypothetical protein
MRNENGSGSISFTDCQLTAINYDNHDTVGKGQEMEVFIIGNDMEIRFTGTIASNVTFDYEEPQTLNDIVSKKLGYNKITVEPGSYKLQANNQGQIVKMEVETE